MIMGDGDEKSTSGKIATVVGVAAGAGVGAVLGYGVLKGVTIGSIASGQNHGVGLDDIYKSEQKWTDIF